MKKYSYKIRTDLAIQNKLLKNTRTYRVDGIQIKLFHHHDFHYTNILFSSLIMESSFQQIKNLFILELRKYLKKYHIKKKDSILVVGLGNKNISSDSLGTKVISYVKATGHMNDLGLSHFRPVYTFLPGVMNDTGMETFKSVKAITKEIKPNLIVIVDSFISGSVEYLNRLIQITDCGIIPGSGICHYQEEISTKTLGIPVIVIGVPTAIEASTIIKDALQIEEEQVEFKKGYDLIVSTKDIDIFVNQIAKLLGEGINQTFNHFNFF